MTRAAYAEWMSEKGQFCARKGNQGSLCLKEDLPFCTTDELSIQPVASPLSRDFSKPSRNNGKKTFSS